MIGPQCCCVTETCESLGVVDLAKATGIEGKTLRVSLPLEDRNFTLAFNSTSVLPNTGNAPGTPKGIWSTAFTITYTESDSIVASDDFAGDIQSPVFGDMTNIIAKKILSVTAETACITGLQRRFPNSIDCNVGYELIVTYGVTLEFECIGGVATWIMSLSASQRFAINIRQPLSAPPTFMPLWNPFFVIEDYTDPDWFPDSWRPFGVPLGDSRQSTANSSTYSENWSGQTPLKIGGSILTPVDTTPQSGALGFGSVLSKSTPGSSGWSLVPGFNPTGLLDFNASIL